MDRQIERIEHQENLPLRIFVHSVRSCASHLHRDCELLLVLQGQVLVQTGAGETILRADDVFFIPGGEIHLTHETTGSNLLLALQIDTAFAVRLDPDFPRRRFALNQIARRTPADPRIRTIRQLMAEMICEMRHERPGYRIQIEALLLRLLLLLVREIPCILAEPAPVADVAEEDALGQRLARIVTHLEQHSREELSSAEVARSEGVSLSYLARLFKTRLGCTFRDYVSLLRAKQSLVALAHREATIMDVALDCGFSNLKSYNIVFKRIYGVTPSQWRRQQRGKDVPGLGDSAYNRINTTLAFHLIKRHLAPASPFAT